MAILRNIVITIHKCLGQPEKPRQNHPAPSDPSEKNPCDDRIWLTLTTLQALWGHVPYLFDDAPLKVRETQTRFK